MRDQTPLSTTLIDVTSHHIRQAMAGATATPVFFQVKDHIEVPVDLNVRSAPDITALVWGLLRRRSQ